MTLRVAILSRGPRLYSTRRLVEEANALGCSVDVLDPTKLSVSVGNDGRRILHEGWNVEVDAVVPRAVRMNFFLSIFMVCFQWSG